MSKHVETSGKLHDESDKKHDFVDRPISDDFYLIAVMRGNMIYTLH